LRTVLDVYKRRSEFATASSLSESKRDSNATRGGTIRAYAMLAKERSAALPEVLSDPFEPGKADLLRELSARGTKRHEHQRHVTPSGNVRCWHAFTLNRGAATAAAMGG